MGTILVKSALNTLKIEVFKNVNKKKCATKLNWMKKNNLKTSIFKAFKALFTKIAPRVNFYPWPKLSLRLDVRTEIPILKVIYCVCTTWQGYRNRGQGGIRPQILEDQSTLFQPDYAHHSSNFIGRP